MATHKSGKATRAPGAGAKPKASLLRMTPEQFECVLTLGAFRRGDAIKAARRVMVEGLTMAEAARTSKPLVSQIQVNNARARIVRIHNKLAAAYGAAQTHP